MFPQKNRFTTKNFEFLRRKMKGFRSDNFLFLNGEGRDRTRFAVVIGKKIEKSAVRRNQFRRRVYEIFRKDYFEKCSGINTICLYKGTKIPKNTAEIQPHIQKYIDYLARMKR